MTDTKWTPGPWAVKNETSVYYQHGFLCAAPVIRVDETRNDGESWLDMRRRTDPDRADAYREMKANAHLIAAAPDLYSALAGYLDAVSGVPMRAVDCDQDEVAHWHDKAQDALAKARGES